MRQAVRLPYSAVLLTLFVGMLRLGSIQAQDARKIPVAFLPPPLENATYSLGIFEVKTGKLVRRLQEIAPESAFTVGLNGLMTSWDGKDDTDKSVAPGRYAARGYAVGPMKVEGEKILGNDWTAAAESFRPIFISAISCAPDDDGLIVSAQIPYHAAAARFSGADGRLLWQRVLPTSGDMGNHPGPPRPSAQSTLVVLGNDVLIGIGTRPQFAVATNGEGTARLAPETGLSSERMRGVAVPGKDGTTWKVEDGQLSQVSSTDEVLRSLVPAEGEPRCEKVAASTTSDKLYLLERLPTAGWERVRGLSWVESKEENGKKISTWQTFFERNIRPPDVASGLGSPLAVDRRSAEVEIALVTNPLSPSKHGHVKLVALCEGAGSYLMTSEGLRLRQIAQNFNLCAVKLVRGKTAGSLTLFQADGAAWDEFSIEGAKNMMEFDAGEIEMTADGEKAHPGKSAEPPDL